MPIASENLLRVTYALLQPDTAAAAIERLRGRTERAAVEGLVELLYKPPSVRLALATIDALAGCDEPLVCDALVHALHEPHASVRLAAVAALHQRRAAQGPTEFLRLLNGDESWMVRRAALTALAGSTATSWSILDAATDPHWRVRHALIGVLLQWDSAERPAIEARLLDRGATPRVRGVLAYLRYRWSGVRSADDASLQPEDPRTRCPFWDWDAYVLARNLERMSTAAKRQALDALPFLVGHADERVRGLAVSGLRTGGTAQQIAEVIALLDEPRNGAGEAVAKLLGYLDLDRVEEVVAAIFALPVPSPAQVAWARDRVGPDRPVAPIEVRLLKGEATHPHVRAAALTPGRAAELVQNPERETSWHVLAQAARLARVPLWNLAPQPPWQPDAIQQNLPSDILNLQSKSPPHARRFGPEQWAVAPLGVSGHYGLPVDGFVRAVEVGVNLLFWEPNYHTMTEFFNRLPAGERNRLYLVAGTFEADGRRVRRDAERVLRLLKVERIAVFLLFWVQSWERITPDVREALECLKKEGKIATFGLSTHSRSLAVEAMNAAWNPVMVRHSAAHRGAESAVFPRAVETGTTILTFNNTCYGRLLKPHGETPPPSAADCYRYTLAQSAVTACWSAPATLAQLDENLAALRDPTLPPEQLRELLAHGEGVYEEDAIFRKLVRAL